MKNKIFIPQLNSLRFFAAIAIVIFHFGRWSHPFANSSYPISFNLAVSFFFVLSGFIMATVYNNLKTFSFKETYNFYLKRFVRIIPLYVLALILTIFFIDEDFTLKEFFLNLFFLQAWSPEHALSLNFPGWSLSVEMFFYLLFPFVFPFITKRKELFRFTFIFWLLSNLIVLIFYFLNYEIEFIKYYPLFHLNEFLIGIWAGITYLNGINKKAFLLFLGSLMFLFFYLPLISDYNVIHHDGLLAPIFAILILGISGIKSIFLSSKPLVKLGNASYGIYILQFPIYLIIYKLYNDFDIFNLLGEDGRFYIYLIILILISYLSAITFEKWMKRVFLKKETN